MLPKNAFCFSGSASARLSENEPVAENSPPVFCGLPLPHVHGSSPEMPSVPEYGDCDDPRVPKKRSLASNATLPNCVEEKLTCTSPGDQNTTLKCDQQVPCSVRPRRLPVPVALTGCPRRVQLQMSM